MSNPKRILFVNSEIFPYMPESHISSIGRYLPQGVQESGNEIRSFMPKYGSINERRNQLHEVIRLSGMNIIINDLDRPLIIKVSSISSVRMQVYFIDNEDYFYRKHIFQDEQGEYFPDNDERSIFFARGVLETVKKLRWKPDIIHCQGWVSHFLPMFLKKVYREDPIFSDSKVVLSLYNDSKDVVFNDDTKSKAAISGVKVRDMDILTPANGTNLAKLAIQYADGVIWGDKDIDPEVVEFVNSNSIPILEYIDTSSSGSSYIQDYIQFYDKIFGKNEN